MADKQRDGLTQPGVNPFQALKSAWDTATGKDQLSRVVDGQYYSNKAEQEAAAAAREKLKPPPASSTYGPWATKPQSEAAPVAAGTSQQGAQSPSPTVLDAVREGNADMRVQAAMSNSPVRLTSPQAVASMRAGSEESARQRAETPKQVEPNIYRNAYG